MGETLEEIVARERAESMPISVANLPDMWPAPSTELAIHCPHPWCSGGELRQGVKMRNYFYCTGTGCLARYHYNAVLCGTPETDWHTQASLI